MEEANGAPAPALQADLLSSRRDERGEFRALTACRGIAALTVAIYHILNEHYSGLGMRLTGPIGKAYLCVDFFFVLSGFVIAFAYRGYFTGRFQIQDYMKFMIRRIARIYPLYFSVLTFAIGYTLTIYGNFHSGTRPALQSHSPLAVSIVNYLLIFDWGIRVHGFLGVAWSLSAEMAAYVVFPLLLWVSFARRRSVWAAVSIVALCALSAAYSRHRTLDIFEGFPSLVRCLAEFTLGILVFRIYLSGSMWSVRIGSDAALTAIFLVAAVSLLALRSDMIVALSFPALVLCLARNRGVVARLLETKPFHWLGLISYSVYLVHPELQHIAVYLDRIFDEYAWPPTLSLFSATAVTTVLILVTSYATFSWIEVPGRKIVRRIGARFGRPISPALAPNTSS